MRLPHAARSLVLLALAPLAAAQGQLQTVDSTTVNEFLGSSLVRFHDLNGDGWREFLVGVPGADPHGRVHVLSGRYLAQGLGAKILSSVSGSPGASGSGGGFGGDVLGLDDFDGNGTKDFAVAASGFTTGTFPLYKLTGRVSIFDAGGSLKGQVLGPTENEQFGSEMALLGDLNGDGFRDLLISSMWFTGGIPSVEKCGKVAVYSGKSLLQNTAVVLRAHLGAEPNEYFGQSLATGYFNGDAVVDYAVGAPWADSSTGVNASGRVRVYDGATGALLRTIHGSAGTHFGESLSGGLDVTGDGVHDLVIGAPWANTNGAESGSVFVYSGAGLVSGGLLLPTHVWHGPSTGDHFGAAVSVVQDLNGDGRADVLAGAPDYENFPFAQDNGMFRCFSGQTGELLGHRTGQSDEHLGGAFVSADHWDGKPGWEFLVGSPYSALGAGANSGRVESYSIFPNTPTTYCTPKQNSLGCTPSITGVGQPSVAPGASFDVRAANVLNNAPGILVYADDAGAMPFQGGFLCVGLPLTRLPAKFSGGTPPPAADCSGVLLFDFDAHMSGGSDPSLAAGQEVFCQVWSRDASALGGSSLTGGLRFLIHP